MSEQDLNSARHSRARQSNSAKGDEMIKKAIKGIFFGKKDKHEDGKPAGKAKAHRVNKAEGDLIASQWEDVLTQSLKENALAPSDEVILHAYNLYCDELNAPFATRRRAMNEHFSNVIAEFSALQALAPDMIERSAAKHRLELDRFLEKKGRKS